MDCLTQCPQFVMSCLSLKPRHFLSHEGQSVLFDLIFCTIFCPRQLISIVFVAFIGVKGKTEYRDDKLGMD